MKVLGNRIRTAEPRIRTATPAPPPGKQGARWGQGRGGRPWRRLRDRILERDEYLCQACRREGKLTLATEVDHIEPLFLGGTDDESNLESICDDHAKRKNAEEAAAARRARRPST